MVRIETTEEELVLALEYAVGRVEHWRRAERLMFVATCAFLSLTIVGFVFVDNLALGWTADMFAMAGLLGSVVAGARIDIWRRRVRWARRQLRGDCEP